MLHVNIGSQTYFDRPFDQHRLEEQLPRKLIGSAICRCGASTGFQIDRNAPLYISGENTYGSLAKTGISELVKTFFSEAELCYLHGSPNSAATMCRAALEEILKNKGFQGADLFNQIENTKDIFSKEELAMAHGSRLIARNAIHRGSLVLLSQVPSMLSSTVQLLNKLAALPDQQYRV